MINNFCSLSISKRFIIWQIFLIFHIFWRPSWIFMTFPQWKSPQLFTWYSGHIEDTKSAEFVSFAISLRFTPVLHKMLVLIWEKIIQDTCITRLLKSAIWAQVNCLWPVTTHPWGQWVWGSYVVCTDRDIPRHELINCGQLNISILKYRAL